MPVEKSAGAIIFRKDNKELYYLLLHYEAGHWDLPKGHIEKGESEKEAVLREVKEETGIRDVNFLEGFRTMIKYFFRAGGKTLRQAQGRTIFKIVVFYLAETRTKEIKLSFEHIGYSWLPYEEALREITFKNAKAVLKKAHDHLSLKIKNQNAKRQVPIL